MKTARSWIAFLLLLALLLPLLAACAARPTATRAVAGDTPAPAAQPGSPAPTVVPTLPPTIEPAVPPTIEPTVRPTAAPTAATSQAFEKAACPFELPAGQVEGETLECGYLRVPEDRTDPNSAIIRLAVAVFHPSGEAEPDPIVYLEGGPGGSALEFLYLGFPDQVQPYLAANRDVVLFDQRGVGLSEPALDCPKLRDLGLELLDWELDDEQVTSQQAADLIVEAGVACGTELGKTASLAAYNTAASAADVDELRRALGYDQVNLWGISYGTNLALAVMRDYPDAVRSVVLDSVYPPDVDLYVEAPANAARAFDVLFESCAADEACSTAYPDLRQVLTDTVAQLSTSPASFQVTDALTGDSYDTVMTGDDLLGMVFQLLYFDDVIPSLPQIIYDARDGSYDLLRRMLGVLIAQNKAMSHGMFYSVECRDEVAFSSQDEFQATLAHYPALAGMFTTSNVGEIGYRTCAGWGTGRADATANQPVSSDIPTLLLAGEYDPITPPSWGRHVAQTLENGHFYQYPAIGHGVTMVAGCPQDMMIAFIDDPTATPDDSCLAAMPAVEFVVPAQGQTTVEMEPFTNPLLGTKGVAPAGWEQVSPGVYSRGSSALDSAVILQQTAPMSASDLLDLLVGQLGLKERPAVVGEREANGLTWQLYNVEAQSLVVDIALAESGDNALVVLLQAEPKEHDALYESVFIPAVDALQLSK